MGLSKVFTPGMWLMRRLRFATKLFLVVLVLVIPLLVLLYLNLQRDSDLKSMTKDGIAGVQLVEQASELIHAIQIHREQTNRALSGNPAGTVARDAIQARIAEGVAALDRSVQLAGAQFAVSGWPDMRERVQRLLPSLESKSAQVSFALHTAVIEDLNRFVSSLGKDSKLLFGSDPAAYLMMDMVVSRVGPWTESLEQLRGLGTGLLSTSVLDEGGASVARAQVNALNRTLLDLQLSVRLMDTDGISAQAGLKAIDASTEFAEIARARLAVGSAAGNPQGFFAAGTQAIDAVTVYQKVMTSALDETLRNRVIALDRLFWAVLAGSVLGLVLVLYFVAAFYISFLADLREVLSFMKSTVSGDLRHAVNVRGKDEMADFSQAAETLVNNVSVMVASVRSNAALVASAGAQLISSNRALSDRTEQQAANLEQTSASVHELTTTVQNNASAAQQSDTTAQSVKVVAEKGGQSMADAIRSVESIQNSTKRMDEIVGVIDGLAFQTNILALNAAVEAARAGESGRGFAVVASEVRSLAQRSAAAAKEIRLLIGESGVQVAQGVAEIRKAGHTMQGILSGIRDVADKVSEIATSSEQQSSSLVEISQAVQQLDTITQQNAAMVESAVDQSNQMQARASTLVELVASFKLQQGTADEALGLVQRALGYRKQCRSVEEFLRGVTQPEQGLIDRDMYVFVLDVHGKYLAFAGNASKVGSRVQDIAGIDGQQLIDSITAQADVAPGWVEYDIANPQTGLVQTKISFVHLVDGVYVGCGVYKNLLVKKA